jgi:hypothetical protein
MDKMPERGRTTLKSIPFKECSPNSAGKWLEVIACHQGSQFSDVPRIVRRISLSTLWLSCGVESRSISEVELNVCPVDDPTLDGGPHPQGGFGQAF